jgi:hypothetical protein
MDYDALERLVRLRDSGALTAEEFHAQKAALLARGSEHERTAPPVFRSNRVIVLIAVSLAALIVAALVGRSMLHNGQVPLAVQASAEETSCKADILGNLLNPETAQFFEFVPVGRESYLEAYRAMLDSEVRDEVSKMNVGAGLEGVFAQGMAASAEAIISKNVYEGVDKERARLGSEDLQTYTFRVKAAGKLGNVITSNEYCSAKGSACTCFTPDG